MNNVTHAKSWNDCFARAMRAYKRREFESAQHHLDKAFSLVADEHPEFYLLAGHIALARQEEDAAEKNWRRALEIDPGNAAALNNLGVLLRRQGDESSALTELKEAEKQAPQRPDILYNIANLHKNAGRFDEAVSYYERVIDVDPKYSPAYNNLGTLYTARHERDAALKVLQQGLSADSGNPSLWFNVGMIHQDDEEWEDALDAFSSALKGHPGWVPGLNNLGIVLQEMGREKDAAKVFRNLLRIDPNNAQALNNLGVAYTRLGRTDDAQSCFREAVAQRPTYNHATLNLHDSLMATGKTDAALKELKRHISLQPSDPDLLVQMARTSMDLSRWTEAEKCLNSVLKTSPEHAGALKATADLYLATNRPEAAEAILNQLPHSKETDRDLARLNIQSKKFKSAGRLLNKLVATDAGDAESRRLLADMIAEKHPEKAVRLREEALLVQPDNLDDLLSLARLYGRLDKKEMAMDKLNAAMNHLMARKDTEEFNTVDTILNLYEEAVASQESTMGDLFNERISQLHQRLRSFGGFSRLNRSQRDAYFMDQIPIEAEDALSLLDIEAMEPVFRINEAEDTIYLDESIEALGDVYTELYDDDVPEDEPHPPLALGPASSAPNPRNGEGADSPHPPDTPRSTVDPERSNSSSLPGESHEPASFGRSEQPASLSSQQPPADAGMPVANPLLSPMEEPDKRTLNKETSEPSPPGMNSQGQSPDEGQKNLQGAPTEFSPGRSPSDSQLHPEDASPASLEPQFQGPRDPQSHSEAISGHGTGDENHSTEDKVFINDALPLDVQDLPDDFMVPESGLETGLRELDWSAVAHMLRYLLELINQTSGEERLKLVKANVPIKIAGLHARILRVSRFQDIAQIFDRRRRDRNTAKLDKTHLITSLNEFKRLASTIPSSSVADNFAVVLEEIIRAVENETPES